MRTLVISLFLTLAAFVSVHAEVTGGPGFADFTPNVGLSDNFQDGIIADRYQIRGIFSPDASAIESLGTLTIDAGTAFGDDPNVDSSFLLGDNRVIYPAETSTFTARIKMAVHPSSTGAFLGGLTLLKHSEGGSELLIVGFSQANDLDGVSRRTAISSWEQGSEELIVLADGQFVEIILEYSGGMMTASIPEFAYTKTHFVGFEHGFSIGMIVQSAFQPTTMNRGVFTFSDMTSDLFSDVYRVSNTPLSNNGVLYNNIPFTSGLGHASIWFNAPSPNPAFVTVNNTNLSLNGVDNIHGLCPYNAVNS